MCEISIPVLLGEIERCLEKGWWKGAAAARKKILDEFDRLVTENKELKVKRDAEVADAAQKIRYLMDRLMVDLKGEPRTKDALEYADSLVDAEGNARFGELSRLEWMLRVLAHGWLRSQKTIEKLETSMTMTALKSVFDENKELLVRLEEVEKERTMWKQDRDVLARRLKEIAGLEGWKMVLDASPNEGDIVMIWDAHDVYIATFKGGNFMEHNAGYDGDVDENSCVTHWRPLPKPPYTLPSADTIEQLQAVAFDYDRMYANIREMLAETGFEILKDDVKKAVGNLSERGEALSYDVIIREALGQEKYAEFEKRKK